MSFGEVDLAGSDAGADEEKDISVVGTLPNATAAAASSMPESAAEATFFAPPPPGPLPAVSSMPVHRRPTPAPRRRRPLRPRIVLGLAVLAVLGGSALELTPNGAFGYLVASDWIHAAAYGRATLATVRDTEMRLGADTYDGARSAADAAAASHASLPRAKSLTAYAALVDFAVSVRFGVDSERRPRGKQLLEELPAKEAVRYRSVASAAQVADAGDIQRALTALAAADRSPRAIRSKSRSPPFAETSSLPPRTVPPPSTRFDAQPPSWAMLAAISVLPVPTSCSATRRMPRKRSPPRSRPRQTILARSSYALG